MAKTPPKAPKTASRRARLAEALKANLKRRKTQARSRDGAKIDPDEPKKR